MNVQIRRATAADIFEIAAIHASSWQATYQGMLPDDYLATVTAESREPLWSQVLQDAESTTVVWVAENERKLLAFCSWGPSPDDPHAAEIQAIYVKPGMERKGLGRTLLASATNDAVSHGFTTIVIWVLRDNVNARAFYESCGWQSDDVVKVDHLWGIEVSEVRYLQQMPG
jgi:ribosomal protein S18 acetylase RimI-like enzyme